MKFERKTLLPNAKSERTCIYRTSLDRMESPPLAPSPDLNVSAVSVQSLRRNALRGRTSIFGSRKLPSISPLRRMDTRDSSKIGAVIIGDVMHTKKSIRILK